MKVELSQHRPIFNVSGGMRGSGRLASFNCQDAFKWLLQNFYVNVLNYFTVKTMKVNVTS